MADSHIDRSGSVVPRFKESCLACRAAKVRTPSFPPRAPLPSSLVSPSPLLVFMPILLDIVAYGLRRGCLSLVIGAHAFDPFQGHSDNVDDLLSRCLSRAMGGRGLISRSFRFDVIQCLRRESVL